MYLLMQFDNDIKVQEKSTSCLDDNPAQKINIKCNVQCTLYNVHDHMYMITCTLYNIHNAIN